MDLLKAVSSAVNKGSAVNAIEDVFSTYVYTGTGATQSIVNGVDLSTEGGMVWTKAREIVNTINRPHELRDTERGFSKSIQSNSTNGEFTLGGSTTTTGYVTSFNEASDNYPSANYASWTFRKAPRFFDVVTYTGNGVAGRAIPHELGVAPGMIIVKNLGLATNWNVYHKSTGNTGALKLDTTAAFGLSVGYWNNTSPTDTAFTLGNNNSVNDVAGYNYVAYLFADDPDGPSGDGSDGLIACGSFVGAVTASISLGWEPQYLLIKSSTTASNWEIYDCMRGMIVGGNDQFLKANASDIESGTVDRITITPDGFETNGYSTGNTYIYMAIRRGFRVCSGA